MVERLKGQGDRMDVIDENSAGRSNLRNKH